VSKPKEPVPVKLVASLFSSEKEVVAEALKLVSAEYGKLDYISTVMPFEYTDYYREEMGWPLVRRFVSFEQLIGPAVLPDVKLFANSIENRFVTEGKRKINIDPGYLAKFHLILATGKGYAHRPYLRDGIYADITLIYRDKAFHPLEWTYPDYRSRELLDILTKIRKKYIFQLRKEKF
jgi:hypothetical protein